MSVVGMRAHVDIMYYYGRRYIQKRKNEREIHNIERNMKC